MVAQIFIGGITGKEGVVRVECSLGACAAALTGSFPSCSGQGGEGSGCTSLFLTGVDEQTKATANKDGAVFGADYVIALVPFTLYPVTWPASNSNC